MSMAGEVKLPVPACRAASDAGATLEVVSWQDRVKLNWTGQPCR